MDLNAYRTRAERGEVQLVLDQHRRRLVDAARKRGQAVTMLTDSVEGVRRMIAPAATIMNYASDAAVVTDARGA